MYTLSTQDMRVSHVFSVTDPSARSSTLLATHLRSMLTCSTGYQRPQPRTITRSCPFHLLMATTDPMGQLTRVLPRKACSTRAALIWRTLVECIDSSFQDALLRNAPPLSLPLHSGLLGRSGAGCGEHKCDFSDRLTTEKRKDWPPACFFHAHFLRERKNRTSQRLAESARKAQRLT